MSGTIATNDSFEWQGGSGSFHDPDQWADLTDPQQTGTAVPASMATVTFTSGEVTDRGSVATVSVEGDMTFDDEIGGTNSTNSGNIVLNGTTASFVGSSLDNTSGNVSGNGLLDFGSITNGGSIGVDSLQVGNLDNNGQVAVQMLNAQSVTNDGTIDVSDFASIPDLTNSGNLHVANTLLMTTLTNTGSLSGDDGVDIEVSGSADIGGSVQIANGATLSRFLAVAATVESGTTVQVPNGQFSSETVAVLGGAAIMAYSVAIGGTIAQGGRVAGGIGGVGLQAVTVAGSISASNFLNVDGPVTVLPTGRIAVTGSFNVNILQTATLDVAGGTVDAGNSSVFDSGLLNVHGASSLFSDARQLTVGVTSPGTAEVTNQATINSKQSAFGVQNGTGLGIVDAAHWTNSNGATVGVSQAGTLIVRNTGTFDSGSVQVGQSVRGTVTVDGASSLLQIGGGISVPLGLAIVQNTGTLTSDGSDEIGEQLASNLPTPSGTVDLESGGIWTSGNSIQIGLGTIIVHGGTLASTVVDIGTAFGTQAANGLVSASGSDSKWTNSGSIGVGDNRTGTLALSAGASLKADGNIVVGVNAGGDGTITIDGSATLLDVADDLIVGEGGVGSLALSNNAAISVGGKLEVGTANAIGMVTDTGGDPPRHFGALAINNGVANVGPGADNPWLVDRGTTQDIDVGAVAGVTGTLNLPQDATLVAGSGTVSIGGQGNGVVTMAMGAVFDAAVNDVTVGDEQGSSGKITVAGDGALMQAGMLTVGGQGTAQLTVSNGGDLQVTNMLTVGDESSDPIVHIVTVTDDGSSAEVGGLSVGSGGIGTLLVAGATFSVTGDAAVGEETTGAGTMTINAGSADVSGTLTVGDAGNGLLLIGLGGAVSADSLEIGSKAGGQGEVDVTAAGSRLSSKDVAVGASGTGTLNITGAHVDTTGDVDVAQQVNGNLQSVMLDQQSLWTVGGGFTVGKSGIASATVKGASLVAVNGDVVVGDQAGSGGTLTVGGSLDIGGSIVPSEISFAGALTVGNEGDGSLTVQGGAEVAAISGGKGEIDIGAVSGGTGSAMVTGIGSVLQGDSLAVGGDADKAGGQGTLTVASGALVQVTDAHVWGDGRIVLAGGTLATDPLTLDAGGQIDGNGMVVGAIDDAGTITASDGTLALSGSITGTGEAVVDGGATLALQAGVASSLGLDFASAGGTLLLGTSANVQAPISSFGANDAIGIDGQAVTGFGYNIADNVLTLDGGAGAHFALTLVGSYTQDSFKIQNGELVMPCFVRGTRIATPRGELLVEALRAGDMVCTASGGTRPVVWIGERRVDCGRHPRPQCVWPVRLSAGAFGSGVPQRDLLLSPDHAVFIDGVLIPVKYLIDGEGIAQQPVASVHYFHIELDRHDVLLAEGLAAESYLHTGQRGIFANAAAPLVLHPDFMTCAAPWMWEAFGCAPLVIAGPVVDAVRSRLARSRGQSGTVRRASAASQTLSRSMSKTSLGSSGMVNQPCRASSPSS